MVAVVAVIPVAARAALVVAVLVVPLAARAVKLAWQIWAAVVAALYNILSADAPVGAPPEGNAKEVTRRRRRVTTTASSNDVL